MPIRYIDLKVLGDDEVQNVQQLTLRYYEKLQRMFPRSSLELRFKRYRKTGKRAKYSVHCRVDAPSIIARANASYWDLALTMHKVLNKVHNELEHKYKLESQHKPFGKESKKKRRKANALKR